MRLNCQFIEGQVNQTNKINFLRVTHGKLPQPIMEEVNNKHPLLCSRDEERQNSNDPTFPADAGDSPPITGAGDFFREFSSEAKKLWYLAGPSIFTIVCQYSISAVTQIFAGHLGTLELAAVSVQAFVIATFAFGLLVTFIITSSNLSNLS